MRFPIPWYLGKVLKLHPGPPLPVPTSRSIWVSACHGANQGGILLYTITPNVCTNMHVCARTKLSQLVQVSSRQSTVSRFMVTAITALNTKLAHVTWKPTWANTNQRISIDQFLSTGGEANGIGKLLCEVEFMRTSLKAQWAAYKPSTHVHEQYTVRLAQVQINLYRYTQLSALDCGTCCG